MKRKNVNLLLGIAAAAVLGAFNPAFAAGAGVGAGVKADADVNANANADQKASGSPSQGAASADSSTGAKTEGNASAGASVSPGIDKKKGLDRADQAAGEHGKRGRDNAREKQSTNRY